MSGDILLRPCSQSVNRGNFIFTLTYTYKTHTHVFSLKSATSPTYQTPLNLTIFIEHGEEYTL